MTLLVCSNYKYYDTNTIIDEGILHQSEFSNFHHNSQSLDNKLTSLWTIGLYLYNLYPYNIYIILNHNFHVIGFTETRCNSDDDSNLIDI